MSVLAGPFVIAACVLALGGGFKAIEPADTVGALRAVGLSVRSPAVRVGGAAEFVIGVGALVVGGPVFAALVALSYLAFTGFVVIALRSGSPVGSCGCFGKTDTPPSMVHVVLDLAAAIVAVTIVLTGAIVALPDVMSDQPLFGIPFAILCITGVALVFLAFTSLPKVTGLVRLVREDRS